MSKVFLDTNVLIYSVDDKDSPDKRDDALTLLKQIGHSGMPDLLQKCECVVPFVG